MKLTHTAIKIVCSK